MPRQNGLLDTQESTGWIGNLFSQMHRRHFEEVVQHRQLFLRMALGHIVEVPTSVPSACSLPSFSNPNSCSTGCLGGLYCPDSCEQESHLWWFIAPGNSESSPKWMWNKEIVGLGKK